MPQAYGIKLSNRIFGLDSRFREDETYLFFLYVIKESLEITRAVHTFFRKGKAKNDKYSVDFMLGCDRHEIDRYDVKFKAFKAIRGTQPYFEYQRLKLMSMIRQIGAPHIFLTLSAAEIQWFDLIRDLLKKETGRYYTDDDISKMHKTDLNKNLD